MLNQNMQVFCFLFSAWMAHRRRQQGPGDSFYQKFLVDAVCTRKTGRLQKKVLVVSQKSSRGIARQQPKQPKSSSHWKVMEGPGIYFPN